MKPTVIIEPAYEPVSLAEARRQCRLPQVTHAERDAMLALYIMASRQYVEKQAWRAICEQTLEIALPCFPPCDRIPLPWAVPLIAIESVKYTDSDEVERTFSDTLYLVDTTSEPGAVVLRHGESWPSFTPSPSNAVRIRYRAGAAATSPITPPKAATLRVAILMLLTDLWENGQASVLEIGVVAQVANKRVDQFIAHNVTVYAF